MSTRTVFHIGQPSDHVLRVMKRTGRERTRLHILDVTTTDGQAHDLSGQDDRLALVAMSKMKIKGLTLEWWLSCGTILTLARSREADGSGPLCYRVKEIRQVERPRHLPKKQRPRKRK